MSMSCSRDQNLQTCPRTKTAFALCRFRVVPLICNNILLALDVAFFAGMREGFSTVQRTPNELSGVMTENVY